VILARRLKEKGLLRGFRSREKGLSALDLDAWAVESFSSDLSARTDDLALSEVLKGMFLHYW